ncbi:ETC complex I subunit conserved region [Sphingomonas palmae]|uniref:ETC complex I subunit conserved region n=1 Tax=Sphingomonas palmae TaxID=1855283 RepID=A0A1H7LLJ6_9SPHN|nr:ETC complex I subunit [Sphingomonas palmae]SEK99834.1 ETC complex I subunit conserved region [Sphingomonas palmae]
MANARIYQRPKNAMQSGRFATDHWVLEFEPTEPKRADPLTGWAGSGDVRDQVKLSFPSCDAAVAYAEDQGLAYTVIPTPTKKLKLQSYADNFR